MKFAAVFAAIAAATVVNAQGYNNTHSSNTTKPYDARTVSVPAPSHPPATALTSIYTLTSNCGSVTIYRPSTSIIPLNNGTASTRTATYTGSGSTTGTATGTGGAITASSTGGASIQRPAAAAAAGMGIAGVAGLAAAMIL